MSIQSEFIKLLNNYNKDKSYNQIEPLMNFIQQNYEALSQTSLAKLVEELIIKFEVGEDPETSIWDTWEN